MRAPSARIALAAAALAAAALALALAVGRGGGDGAPEGPGAAGSAGAGLPVSPAAADARGRALFRGSGCGACHTLAAAGTTGTAGPDLDLRRPTRERVVRQVTGGGRGMPSFRDRLDARQVAELAAYVAAATSRRRGGPVVAAFRPDGTRLEQCSGAPGCLERAFGNIAFRSGPRAALALLERRMAADAEVERDCHRIAHAIGAAALARFSGDAGAAIAGGTAICWSGYYHGVLERSFAGVSDARLPAVARRLCSGRAVRARAFIAYQCVHGLGHGLMIHTGYDLPLSLRVCDALATGWDRTSCSGGVFMENISSSYGVRSRWLRDDDLLFPCNAVAERHKLYCYLMVTSRILEATGWDWARTAAECRRAEPGWVATCFQSYGRDASGFSRHDPARILALCAGAGDMEGECVYGAARDVTSNDAGGRRAAALCERASAELRARCFEGIGTILGTLHASAEERRAACAALTRASLGDCARGAGVPVTPPPEPVRPAT
jgi:mono/diheme cytochrome c family protein